MTSRPDLEPAATGRPVDPTVYADLQHFYARQSQAFDARDADAWAATFTADAVFTSVGLGGVTAHGREALASGLRRADRSDAPATRHWTGMLVADAVTPGRVRVRSYALIVIPHGGGDDDGPRVERSTVCTDELVHSPAGWAVAHREVVRD